MGQGIVVPATQNIEDVFGDLQEYEKAVRGNDEGALDRARAKLAQHLHKAAMMPPPGCPYAEPGCLQCEHMLKADGKVGEG